MRILFYITLCLLMNSCGLSHLTAVQNQDTSGPSAKECGSCHVEQYAEWQQTAHARAFISPEFKLQSDEYQDQDCLFCHSPGGVQNPVRTARSYNREEGVTCVSCHLYEQAMHGPHESGALFSPHAVAKNRKLDSKMESSQLCAVCHQETYEQWQSLQADKEYPTCHGCHGAPVERSHTRGTSLFSNMLVAFEPIHTVRSHQLIQPNQLEESMGPELQFDEVKNDTIRFTLTNTLPHDLPTGSFGAKELFFILRWPGEDGVTAPQEKIGIDLILAPGQEQSFTVDLSKREYSPELSIDLYRFHHSTGAADLIRSFPVSIVSPVSP